MRWYCKYGITYRDLAEMMQERGVEVDASTIFRWMQRYAPDLEKAHPLVSRLPLELLASGRNLCQGRWTVEVLVPRRRQAWADDRLHAADRRNTCAAHRFLGKALKTMRNWPPHSITTDKLGSYPKAIRRLQREGKLPQETNHRTSKYLNNIIEAVASSG
jgi:transposase, IS6 family